MKLLRVIVLASVSLFVVSSAMAQDAPDETTTPPPAQEQREPAPLPRPGPPPTPPDPRVTPVELQPSAAT
ncbi:MAG: hypothetical protein M3Y87_05030, partial [Myxococcota bacterium]|nr:hypothetical protein [Myxococcota bacterium]